MLSQPIYQQYKGAQNDWCSNMVIEHKDIDRKTNDKTVDETGYHDHDMQTGTTYEHLEQIT